MDLMEYLEKLDLKNIGKSLLFSDLEDDEEEDDQQEDPVPMTTQAQEPASPKADTKTPEKNLNNVVDGLCISESSPNSSKA